MLAGVKMYRYGRFEDKSKIDEQIRELGADLVTGKHNIKYDGIDLVVLRPQQQAVFWVSKTNINVHEHSSKLFLRILFYLFLAPHNKILY